jgi:hypothetical protein
VRRLVEVRRAMVDGWALMRLATRIEQMQRNAEADLLAATGDLSLCVLARSGRSVPAVKYHEGRAAVLAAVRRRLAAAEDDARRTVAGERRRLQARASLAARDPQWEAYLQGGLDALERIDSLLDEPTG